MGECSACVLCVQVHGRVYMKRGQLVYHPAEIICSNFGTSECAAVMRHLNRQ